MKSILVIDDEADIVELVAYNLKKEGFNVDTAHDGEQGLKNIGSKRYDLIFLDLMLPGIQGVELCKMVRNNPDTSRIPIVMLTAKGEEIDKILGLEVGADDYITKPFSPRELVARAKAILRRAEQTVENSSRTCGGREHSKDKRHDYRQGTIHSYSWRPPDKAECDRI